MLPVSLVVSVTASRQIGPGSSPTTGQEFLTLSTLPFKNKKSFEINLIEIKAQL